MERRQILAAILGTLLAAALVWRFAPETGPELAPALPPAPVPPAPAPPDARPAPDPVPDPEPAEGRLPPAARLDIPGSPIDPDQVFTGDRRGLAAAAVSRRDDFVACLDRYRADDPEDEGFRGRFVLELSLAVDGTVDARVATGPDELELHNCVGEAMASAHFEPPEQPERVMWSVPLPEPAIEPDDEDPEDPAGDEG